MIRCTLAGTESMKEPEPVQSKVVTFFAAAFSSQLDWADAVLEIIARAHDAKAKAINLRFIVLSRRVQRIFPRFTSSSKASRPPSWQGHADRRRRHPSRK